MKKLTILLIVLIVVSCKTTTSTTKSTPKFNLSDDWLLKKVSFLEPNMFDKIVLFNDVTNQCFKDSRWHFNPTGNVGTYSINDLYCPYGKRNLSFRFLKTDEKTGYSHIVLNAINKAGFAKDYRVKITELTNSSMQWNYIIYVNNKRHTINLQFERIQNVL